MNLIKLSRIQYKKKYFFKTLTGLKDLVDGKDKSQSFSDSYLKGYVFRKDAPFFAFLAIFVR